MSIEMPTNMPTNMLLDPWPYPRLFAHRGGGTHAPENTMAAFRKGLKRGFHAVEFDVKLSSDGVPMLMHDDTLDRTTNAHGPFAARTASELAKLDAGSWFDVQFQGERIPTFAEVAEFLKANRMAANVEIKPCPGREAETGSVVGAMCARLWEDQLLPPLISSFSLEALRAARAAAPTLPIGFLAESFEPAHLPLMDELRCVSFECAHQEVTPALVADIHATGRRLFAYTVNDPIRMKSILALGVDGVFTDALAVMAREFSESLSPTGAG